jgi:hypothetical protein
MKEIAALIHQHLCWLLVCSPSSWLQYKLSPVILLVIAHHQGLRVLTGWGCRICFYSSIDQGNVLYTSLVQSTDN